MRFLWVHISTGSGLSGKYGWDICFHPRIQLSPKWLGLGLGFNVRSLRRCATIGSDSASEASTTVVREFMVTHLLWFHSSTMAYIYQNNWRTPQNFTIYSCTILSAVFVRTYKYTLLVNGQSSKCLSTRQRCSPMNHFYFKRFFCVHCPKMCGGGLS